MLLAMQAQYYRWVLWHRLIGLQTNCQRRAGLLQERTVMDKALEELNEWKYQLAYYSKEEGGPTPEGVKKFIGDLLEQIDRLKARLERRGYKTTKKKGVI